MSMSRAFLVEKVTDNNFSPTCKRLKNEKNMEEDWRRNDFVF